MTMQICGLARSRNKLKSLFVQYRNAYGCQTWQGGDIKLEASFYKVTRLFDHVVLKGYMEIISVTSLLSQGL